MLRALRKELYGGPDISVPTIAPAQMAASRLSEHTPRRGIPWGLRDTVVGSVSEDRVVLFRVRPLMFGAGLVLYGRFKSGPEGTHLTGQFQHSQFSKIFLTLWFGGIGLFCIASIIGSTINAAESGGPMWLGFLLGLGFASFGVALGAIGYFIMRVSRWMSSSDVPRIVHHIETHIGRHAV